MPNPSDYDDIFGPGTYPSNGPLDFDKERCACDCSLSSRTGDPAGAITSSGWCFPAEASFIPDPLFIFDEKLDLGPQPGDTADITVTRSSGTNGVCDTIYADFGVPAYYCIEGRVANSGYPIENRTADVFIVLPQNECFTYTDTASLPTGANGAPYYQVTGVPMTYFPDAKEYRSRFSMSICGIDISGCCPTGLELGLKGAYATCYLIAYRVAALDDCENQMDQTIDGLPGTRYFSTTVCSRYENCEQPGSLNPFNNTGINVSQDSNRWKIMNESIKIQSGIPAQSGIYPDGSDVGVYVSPVDPQQLP